MREKNQVIQTIMKRRSTRIFTEKSVPDDDLRAVLQCGLYAPSGKNSQLSRFIVLRERSVLEELNRLVGMVLAEAEADPETPVGFGAARARESKGYPFYNRVPVLIVAVSVKAHANSMADCSCALMNMQIAAEALGLASCWRNQLRWLKDDPAVRAFLKRYGMREDEEVFGSLQMGYSAERWDAPRAPRRPGRIIFDDGRKWEN